MKKIFSLIICLFTVLSTYSSVKVQENRSSIIVCKYYEKVETYTQIVEVTASSFYNNKFKLYDSNNNEIKPLHYQVVSAVNGYTQDNYTTFFTYTLKEGKYTYKYGNISGSFIVEEYEVRELNLYEKILDFFGIK